MNNGNGDILAGETKAFQVRQKGWQAWLHWNSTYRWTGDLRIHASDGTTYDPYQRYAPGPEALFTGDKIYENYYTLNLALGADYALGRYVGLSLNVIFGKRIFHLRPEFAEMGGADGRGGKKYR